MSVCDLPIHTQTAVVQASFATISTRNICEPHTQAARTRARLASAQTIEDMSAVCRHGVDHALRDLGVSRAQAAEQNLLEEVKRSVSAYVTDRGKRAAQAHMDHLVTRIMVLVIGHFFAAGGTTETISDLNIVTAHGDFVDRGGLKCGVGTFPSSTFKEALARISSEVSSLTRHVSSVE